VEGATDRSYGIHVARLAGVPPTVLQRARQLLGELAVHHGSPSKSPRQRKSDDSQMNLFVDPVQEIKRVLAAADPDNLTPQQAHALITELKRKLS
jgi:DNA mismatch repair protein MutS